MKICSILSVAAATILAAAGASSADLIVNGDFTAGNSGFTSQYGYVPPADIFAPATYSIVSFDTLHSSWVDFADHTTGNPTIGRYMVVNGTDAGLGPAWAEDVNLTPGTYNLSGWFASLFPASPASLQFHVVNTGLSYDNVSSTFTAPLPPGTWAERGSTFTVTTAGTYSVQIWDVNDAFTGNDYAIDDIHLTAVPLPPASMAGLGLLAGVAGMGVLRRRGLARN